MDQICPVCLGEEDGPDTGAGIGALLLGSLVMWSWGFVAGGIVVWLFFKH